MLRRIMTQQEVATLMRVNPSTIRRWTSQGEGPPRLRGKRSRPMYDEADVERWIEARKEAARQE